MTSTTKQLLQYRTGPARKRRLFFCEVKGLKTFVYSTKVARRGGAARIANELRASNEAIPLRPESDLLIMCGFAFLI
jgi:hypothetical protein